MTGEPNLSGATSTHAAGRPRATVAIITRNRRSQLLRTLDRLAEIPENPEVIVTDNASTDGTAAAVGAYHPSTTVLRPGRNLGALGRNLAVAHAATDYVAFCDDDSWWEPGSLDRACRVLDAHPGLGLLAARTLVGAGPGARPDPLNERLAEGPSVFGFLGCAAVVRRSAFMDCGGFHPLLFFGAEETLLAYDLAAHGWARCYRPDVVARHDPDPDAPGPDASDPDGGDTGSGDTDSGRADRSALVRRNEVLTAWLRRPLPLALRRTGALSAAAVHDRASRKALRGTLRRLPAALRMREPLPQPVEKVARAAERRPGTRR
ncbi:glycosyltransferase [Streptomyces sp. A7024]|uniref:Glycosyltransferase n=1 Tax=Streptomyces coryli TaxID=1128680 RepID=A0A6G4U9K4_9ACTN|nr:glycosyltransferase [Streptomyces coryli]NGN68864.1 glycosyltransferase [Streptomyces coryli]